MKKILVLLSLVLVMFAFTACGSKDNGVKDTGAKDTKETVSKDTDTKETDAKETETKEAAVKTGLAVVTSIASSKDAGEKDGVAQANSTAVAVLVDDNGVIKNVVIDVIQTKANISATGEITTDLATEFVSKGEIGAAYGMINASSIGKEWNEQAAALAEYVTGKTIDQVKGIAIDEKGYVTEEDLTSSVTMNIGDMIVAIEKAVNNAISLGATENDKLGLGLTSVIGGRSKNAGEADGMAQAYTNYGVITVDKDGKITSSILDSSQANINFSAQGLITSDKAAEFQTKQELGDAYGMKAASQIEKEWYEQANAFSDYIAGKTVSEVAGIAIEDGKATEEDLTSSVTVTVSDFIKVIEKANASAK